jgi:hypothetical protein
MDQGIEARSRSRFALDAIQTYAVCWQKLASFWQPGFYDHLLRSDENYAEKWEYVFQNPVRAGLVAQAETWRYAGEIVRIDRT